MKNKISIKAAILEKTNSNLSIQEIFHNNILSSDQLLIKIFYSGICGSQLGEISGVKGEDKYLPHLLGHEATGEVLKVSKNTKDFKKGDKVILHWQKNKKKDSLNPSYFNKKNMKINAGWITTFNNYAVVSKNRITKLPKKINKIEGVLFGCALTTAYGAIFRDSKIKLKKKNRILIAGAGMIGQTILFFLSKEKQQIFILEKNQKKLNLIKNLYPDVQVIKCLDDSKTNYFDYVFEATGATKIIEQSFKSIKLTGKLILIGVPHYKKKIRINSLEINYGKKIIGSYGGGITPNKEIPKIIQFLDKKKLKLKNLYDKIYNFNDINLVLKKLKLGKIIKKPILKLF